MSEAITTAETAAVRLLKKLTVQPEKLREKIIEQLKAKYTNKEEYENVFENTAEWLDK